MGRCALPPLMLSVRPPYGWAIIHGGKLVENRGRGALNWASYEGRVLLIQQGLTDAEIPAPWDADVSHEALAAAMGPVRNGASAVAFAARKAIIGAVRIDDVHLDDGTCCRPWGQSSYEAGGHLVNEVTHLVLPSPIPIDPPIDCPGRLGMGPARHGVLDDVADALERAKPQHQPKEA